MAEKHWGTHATSSVKPYTYDLEPGEYITHISGRTGGHVDRLVIHTNKGREFTAGGSGGGARDWKVPAGAAVIALHGAVNGHLHNFGCTYVSLDKFSAKQRAIFLGEALSPTPAPMVPWKQHVVTT